MFKTATVTPIFKKSGSIPNNFSNLCPIPNIQFIYNILEKVVIAQLHSHLSLNSLYVVFKSGFRPHYSIIYLLPLGCIFRKCNIGISMLCR